MEDREGEAAVLGKRENIALNASISLVPGRFLRGANLINPLATRRHASLSLNLAGEPCWRILLLCCHTTHQGDVPAHDTIRKEF